MAIKLNSSEVDFLRSQPAKGKPNKLKLALRIAGVTQKAFAQALGIPEAYFSRIIHGRDLNVSTARTIADAFGVGLDDLFRRHAQRARGPKAAAKVTRRRTVPREAVA